MSHKEPWFALTLSYVLPGLGEMYTGRWIIGIIVFTVVVIYLGFGIASLIDCNTNPQIAHELLILALFFWIVSLILAFSLTRRRRQNREVITSQRRKDPFLAIFFTFIVPGLGHIFVKSYRLGIFLIIVYAALLIYVGDFFRWPITHLFGVAVAYFAIKEENVRVVSKQLFPLAAILLLYGSSSLKILATRIVYEKIGWYQKIEGISMQPTLENNDNVVWRRVNFKGIKRGDILRIRIDEDEMILKRAIAFEGETVEIKQGTIFVDGKKTDSESLRRFSYVVDSLTLYGEPGDPYRIPPGYLYVLGDNTHNSLDSRHYGAVEAEQVIGVVCKIIWPWNRMALLRAQSFE